jgi:hypothetical protein
MTERFSSAHACQQTIGSKIAKWPFQPRQIAAAALAARRDGVKLTAPAKLPK